MGLVDKKIIGSSQLESGTMRFELGKYSLGNGNTTYRLSGLQGKQELNTNPFDIDTGNILPFNLYEGEVNMIGMHVLPEQRGTGVSDILFHQALRISNILNGNQIHTSNIRKPILAKKLVDWGFIPLNSGIVAHILEAKGDTPDIDIYTTRPSFTPREKSRRVGHVFYNTREVFCKVSTEDIPVSNTVPIETRFLKEGIKNYSSDELLRGVIGKHRFFPSRVKDLLKKA